MEELFDKVDKEINNVFLNLMQCPEGTPKYDSLITTLAQLYTDLRTLLNIAQDGLDEPVYNFKYANLELIEKTLIEYNEKNKRGR